MARAVLGGIAADLPAIPSVLNVNVPNVALQDVRGWCHTVTGSAPPRSLTTADLVPKEGHAGTYRVQMSWGEPGVLAEDTDGGSVMAGKVSLPWLNRLRDEAPPADDWAAEALASLLG